jgi:hypothetical protein
LYGQKKSRECEKNPATLRVGEASFSLRSNFSAPRTISE